ncbi:arylsulfatase [Stieleria varia]|uniref:Arylsulfatase n=1 Tax=Stieleria varia TaxID=2528005 RepID=A0A5C6AYX0_9BACT|nr:arylsulfatase [Stieleria varia]TWU04349.1 Arylsulfatase [Stieleria varia]
MIYFLVVLLCLFGSILSRDASAQADAQTVESRTDGLTLPFPPTPMDSVAKPRLQDSTMKWPENPERLPKDAPNILIVMLDDVGFGVSETFGGEVKTPTFEKIASEGLRYNAFHTCAICSPTRASLLTGRNHTRIGSGTIAERAVAFDGFTGIIPKSAATIAEVLKQYGYHTSAFGKWHNTPATETTALGPKDRWPNGYGFEHFYGFLGGETSQWEPRLTLNYDAIEPPVHDPEYHFTVDMADRAVAWMENHQAFAPDKPFFMYWAPGGVHGPHHVFPQWADKYKGQFDDGWDEYRKRVHQRQLKMGVIPSGTKLTERDETLEGWDDIPENQRAFQCRLMELYAGYLEHTDVQVGRVVDGLERLGIRENTLIIYIFGDNGSSSEGQHGSISELLAQNNIPNTIDQQLAALERIGGIDALGTSRTDNMYHAGWAWAGGTPFKGTKLLGAYFGGTRNPMAISWPKKIEPDTKIRSQFHHVIDIAPTIYELLQINPPEVVNGIKQIPIDGVSLAYTFDDGEAEDRKSTQFFDNNGSRAIYHDGWMACAFGPFIPWNTPASVQRIRQWDSASDQWELYNLTDDFSQANDLAQQNPQKLAELKEMFLKLAAENKDFPIGAGNWLRLNPEDRVKTSYMSWKFNQSTRRMPEFAAPGVGRQSSDVRLSVELGDRSSGVLYAVGGSGGGLTVYMDAGHLVYEYNMMIIENYTMRSKDALSAGKHTIDIQTVIQGPGTPGEVTVSVDGESIGSVSLARTVPAAFTATESFDVGVDLGSPVSLTYEDRRPFEFDGKIREMTIELK